MKKTIFSSPTHEAFVVHRPSHTVVVSFAERKEPAPAGFAGEAMLDSTEHAYCCIRSLQNDWYVGADFHSCRAMVAAELRNYPRVVLYGFSMGTYGALISAGALNASRVVLMAPVANIHPDKDRRWIGDYQALIGNRSAESLAPRLRPDTELICVYDPKGPDRKHVAELKRQFRVQEILTPRAGHMVLSFLKNGGILGSFTRALFEPQVDVAALQAQVNASKKNNSYYISELAKGLSRHRLLKKIVLQYGLRRFPDDATARLDYAGVMAEEGQHAEAAAMIRAVVARNPSSAISVPVIRALAQYAETGGDPAPVADLVAPYATAARRSREAQLLYSRYLRHTRRFDEAFRAHDSFMQGGPFSAQGFFERGLIFETLDLPYMAEASYRNALAEDKTFQRAAHRLNLLTQTRLEPKA